MIKSMTGFGRGELKTGSGTLIAEVKSVNSKTCNVIVKLPDSLSSLDIQIANYVKSRISRGQVSVLIDINRNGSSVRNKISIDKNLLKEYYDSLIAAKEYLLLEEPIELRTLLGFPGIISVVEKQENPEELLTAIQQVLDIAMGQFIEVRKKEGLAMLTDIYSRLETMSMLVESIRLRSPEVVTEYKERLRKRIGDLMQGQAAIDETRLAMEISVMSDRSDISEEIVRLQSHINQMKDSLDSSDEPVGRHLDFILQEINREINTIASKANDYQISSECIQLKNETEKVREQVQNIE